MRCRMADRVSIERERERFTRHAVHIGSDHPSETRGDIARQRNRLALNVSSAVFFLKSPVGVHSPQESVVASFALELFMGLACIFHFLNARGVGTAPFVRGIHGLVVDLVRSVEHRGDDFLFVEANIHHEIAAIVLQDLRTHHVGLEILQLVVVVLFECHHLGESGAGHKNRSNPVVDQPAGHVYFIAVVERFEALDHHLAVVQIPVDGFAAIFRKAFDPQERLAAREFRVNLRFGELHVAIKCGDRFRL